MPRAADTQPWDQDGGGASPDFSLHVPFKHAALTLVGTPFSRILWIYFFQSATLQVLHILL